jgi:hypothetical protein
MSDDQASKSIEASLESLSKHFQNIQIFCSRIDPSPEDDHVGSTQRMIRGRGNYYARLGQVKEWITMEDEKTRAEAREDYEEEKEE